MRNGFRTQADRHGLTAMLHTKIKYDTCSLSYLFYGKLYFCRCRNSLGEIPVCCLNTFEK